MLGESSVVVGRRWRRFSVLPDGRLPYHLKRRWRDGTTHKIFEPLELIEKLAALVPAPRINLVIQWRVVALSGLEATRNSCGFEGGFDHSYRL